MSRFVTHIILPLSLLAPVAIGGCQPEKEAKAGAEAGKAGKSGKAGEDGGKTADPKVDPKAEPAKAEPAKAEPEKAEPEKAEPEKAEPAKAEPEPGKTGANEGEPKAEAAK